MRSYSCEHSRFVCKRHICFVEQHLTQQLIWNTVSKQNFSDGKWHTFIAEISNHKTANVNKCWKILASISSDLGVIGHLLRSKEAFHYFAWNREDDGGVFLLCNIAQRLKITQLQCRFWLWHHIRRFLQRGRRLLFTLSGNYFRSCCKIVPDSKCFRVRWMIWMKKMDAIPSRDASASAAIARCNCCGKLTSLLNSEFSQIAHLSLISENVIGINVKPRISYISTRSTSIPQGSVAWSRAVCITPAMCSRSVNNSDKFFVPRTFRNVVAASRLVDLE